MKNAVNSIAVKKTITEQIQKTIHVLVSLCRRAFQSEMSALLALEASVVGVNSDTLTAWVISRI